MGNCILAFPDRMIPNAYATPVLSGGSWLNTGGVSLNNLLDRELSTLTRSTNAQTSSTVINIDFGIVRDFRVFGLLNHNLSLTATVRFLYYNDSGHTDLVYDTGALPVWLPFYPQGSLPWGHPSLWNGLINLEDRDGYKFDFIRALPYQVVARYGRLEVVDTTNPDGYVEFGRMPMMPGWQPPTNMSFGAAVRWESNATSSRALAGKRYTYEPAKWREANFRLESMSEGVAMACVMEMQRRLGKSGELLFIYDPDATSQATWMKSFLANMDELSDIEEAGFESNASGFRLVEVL